MRIEGAGENGNGRGVTAVPIDIHNSWVTFYISKASPIMIGVSGRRHGLSRMAPEWRVLGKAGAATAEAKLRRGDRVKAEPDALITMSDAVDLGAQMDAGLLSGLMRSSLGGESLFSQTLTASDGDGDAVFGAPEIGDIELIRMTHPRPLVLTRGSYLASDESVDVSTTMQRGVGNTLLSGTGLFLLRASGQGTLAIAAHGAIMSYTLQPGECRAVDNGHLVAWSESMRFETRLAGRSRSLFSSAFSSVASGEGLMCFFHGPGTLWLQTHKPLSEEENGRKVKRGTQRAAGSSALGGCIVCLVFMLFVGGFASVFIYAAMNGGHWVQTRDGSYTLTFDPPMPRRAPLSPRIASTRYDRRNTYANDAGSDYYDEL